MVRKADTGMASRFLKALAPDADKFTFQTFADRKELKLSRVANTAENMARYKADPNAKLTRETFDPFSKCEFRTFADVAEELEARNLKGAGVFVTVNEMDGEGRKRENFKRFRAIFADMDADKCKTTTPKWPLRPSIVVASNGAGNRHAYWLINGDIAEDAWRGIGERLIKTYGADKNAIDPVRVLRVPGFYHGKGKQRLVKLLECNGGSYTAAEVVKAFPPIKRSVRRATGFLNPADVDRGELRSALLHLANTPLPRSQHGCRFVDDYDFWLRAGFALKRDLGDDGFEIWDEWSKRSDRYPGETASRAKWGNDLDVDKCEDDAIHVGTIFHYAKRHGWSRMEYHRKAALKKAREWQARRMDRTGVDKGNQS